MTELTLDETMLREAARIAHRIAKNDSSIDLSPAEDLGKLLARLVGKSFEQFLGLEERLRNRLKEAAVFVNKNLSDDRRIFGFLQTVCGSLKKVAKITDTSAFAKIAVFLTALVSTDEASALKQSLHLY